MHVGDRVQTGYYVTEEEATRKTTRHMLELIRNMPFNHGRLTW